MQTIATYFENCWRILLELAPWLMAGMLIAGILHAFLPEGFVARHLGRRRWVEVFKAVALGVPLPLCSCGVIPAAIGLKKDGASNGAAVGFLISTPQTGVDSILVSASFLGWPFAIFKVFSALVSGMIGGLLVNLFDKSPVTPQPQPENTGLRLPPVSGKAADPAGCPHCAAKQAQAVAVAETQSKSCCQSAGNATSKAPDFMSGVIPNRGHVWHRFGEMFRFGFINMLGDIYRWLIAGILAAAAISTVLPEGRLQNFWWAQGLSGMLIMLAISIPLYICATASVPLAASLIAAGMSPGSALVLLMAGPTTNVATIGAIYRTFGGKVLTIYLATVAMCSLVLAMLFDFLLAAPAKNIGHVHPLSHPIELVAAVMLLALFAYFIAADLKSRLQK